MGTLLEVFGKFMAYVLLLEEQGATDKPQHSYERVRRDMAVLLQEQEATAVGQALAGKPFLAARLAVLAWADEVILRHKIIAYHDRWQARPLQDEYYGTSPNALAQQTELRQLFGSEPAVREVYSLCLSLGYSGRRGSSLTDRLFLANAPGQPGQATPLQHDDVWSPGFRLTPQPYEMMAPATSARRVPLVLAALLLSVGILVGPWLRVGRETATPCIPSPSLLPTLHRSLTQQPCSRIAVAVQACTVTLSGRIEAETQRLALRGLIQGLQGVQQIDDTALQVISRPFCEALELFEPLNESRRARPGALRVRPNKAGSPPLYVAGEDLTLEVTMPDAFASYLYVDVYEGDGRVSYLYSNQALGQPFAPGSTQTLGLAGGKPIWGIGPPYGSLLVTVIASETPLVFPPSTAPYAPGRAAGYLDQLRQAIASVPQMTALDAAFVFIETRSQ